MRLPRRTYRRLNRARNGVLVGLALCGFLVATVGLPIIEPASLAAARKDKSKPFPCQDRPCGCLSADQCMRSCCCFTAGERVAWARDHGVEPIAELIAAAAREAAHDGASDEHHGNHDLDHGAAGPCEHCIPAAAAGQQQPPATAACCSQKPGQPACAAQDRHRAPHHEQANAASDEEADDDDPWHVVFVVGSLASACHGLGPMSPFCFPTLPPAATVEYFYDWCRLGVVPCDPAPLLSASHQPPTRPPCC